METEDLRDALVRVGLSEYQADAYVTLVELGSAKAVELSKACSVPQARIYDVLRDLEEQGYVETYERGSLHARAQEPSTATSSLERQAETAIEAAQEIESRWERPEIGEHRVSVVNQFETVEKRAVEYIESAEYLVQLAATPAQFEALADSLAAAYDRGVVVKLALHPGTADEAGALEDFTTPPEGRVTAARYRDMPVSFVLLADREDVCFAPPTDIHPVNEYGMIIDDYALGQVFDWYFETALWGPGDVVYDGRASGPPATYASIRDCIVDIQPHLEDGATVRLDVEGRLQSADETVRLTGTVVEVKHDGIDDPLSRHAGRATVVLETEDGTYDVGGWGAMFEDVEARRLVVTAIED